MVSATCRILLPFLLPFLVNAWSHPKMESSSSAATRRNFLKSGPATAVLVVSSLLVSEKAMAYERRDVGGADRSAITAAMNEQAYQTNNRLEASGFKLDTREEEQARLSSALASFTYDGSSSSGQKKKQTGYNNNRAPTTSSGSK